MFRYAIFGLLLAAAGMVSVRLGERGARAFEQLLIDRIEHALVLRPGAACTFEVPADARIRPATAAR